LIEDQKEEDGKMRRTLFRMAVGVMLVLCWTVSAAVAAEFPSKPVTIIIPMSPGGARDVQCRAFASVAERIWGQAVVPLNKPGASGMIGMLAGAQAAPDGYTLTGTSTADMCALEWELANGRKPAVSRFDFVYIGMFTLFPHMLCVPIDSPWNSVADLLKDAKAKPGFYSFSSSGMNAGTHLPAEYLMDATGLKFRHVPYNGGGPAVTAIIGKHVDFGFATASSCMPLIQGMKLKPLAVTDNKRYKKLPDVPTLEELGIHNCEYLGWVGLFAPLKTPKPVLDKLRETIKLVSENEAFIKIIEGAGDMVNFRNSDEMTKHLDAESAQISKFYKKAVALEKEKEKK
jgi:tripartite-type tricarboxylate transporter receptor subunit TctC